MPLGMDMLLQSMGVDASALQQNVNAAVSHVKNIDSNVAAVHKRLTLIETGMAELLQNSVTTGTALLRIEDNIGKLRLDGSEHSTGFTKLAEESYPDAAEKMQTQVEGEIHTDGTGNDTGNNTGNATGNDTGNAATNN